MGGLEKKKHKNKIGRNADDIAERRKKKKKKKRRAVISETCKVFKEAGSLQVVSSLNLASNCTDSAIESIQSRPKKKRRLKGLRNLDLPSDEASSEKEKQSLLAWVELCMEPPYSNNLTQGSHGDFEIEPFAKGNSVDKSPNGHTHSITSCFGNDSSGRICNGDAFVAAQENGARDHLPHAHSSKVDQFPSNGQNCLSNHYAERCYSKLLSAQSFHDGLAHGPQKSAPVSQPSRVVNGETSVASSISTYAHHGRSLDACRSAECECSCLAGATDASRKGLSFRQARSGEDRSSCHALELEISNNGSLPKENDCVLVSNSANPHDKKRKRQDDKVLQYVLKRSIVLHPRPCKPLSNKSRTKKTVVIAWGRNIPVTLTSEAHTVQEWISSQSGNLFGLDVEWRPNRAKGEKNKVALLQLCNESECLIIQMLFLDKKPQALRTLLSDPSKSLAGVGVLADGKRLLHDYGLECQGGIELTTLAVERLKRDELRNVGLKVLVQEVLGLKMDKPKRITLSNWAKANLDPAQINYACMDAWASFALSHKLLVDT